MLSDPRVTIVETPAYRRRAARRLTADQRAALVDLLAVAPTLGQPLDAAGRLRRVCWPSGTDRVAQVITWVNQTAGLLFLLAIFDRNEGLNLTAAERGQLDRLMTIMDAALAEGVTGYEQTG